MEAVEAYKEISQIPSSLSINDEDDSELCVCPSKQFSFKQTVLIQTSSSHSNKQFSFKQAVLIQTALIQTVLLDVSVRLVLREKGEVVVDRTQKHRGHLDPILRLLVTPHSPHYLRTSQQRFQVRTPHVHQRTLVHVLGTVEQTDGHVAAQERHPLQEEAPRPGHALLVAAPVLQPVVAEPLDDVEALRRADVPVTLG